MEQHEELIEIIVTYYGHYKKLAGKGAEKVIIKQDILQGIEELRKYLYDKYGIQQDYQLLINNEHVIGFSKKRVSGLLSESDTIKVIQFISGG